MSGIQIGHENVDMAVAGNSIGKRHLYSFKQ
jgi:hypothetical protein